MKIQSNIAWNRTFDRTPDGTFDRTFDRTLDRTFDGVVYIRRKNRWNIRSKIRLDLHRAEVGSGEFRQAEVGNLSCKRLMHTSTHVPLHMYGHSSIHMSLHISVQMPTYLSTRTACLYSVVCMHVYTRVYPQVHQRHTNTCSLYALICMSRCVLMHIPAHISMCMPTIMPRLVSALVYE